MPGQTPIYNFPYPCQGEVINPAVFSLLANAIDAKLLDIQGDYTLMLNRNNSDNGTGVGQVIAAGVDTVLTHPSLNFTINRSGVYIVRATANGTPAGNVNMRRLHVRQNAVVRFGATVNTETNTFMPPVAAGPVVAAAGDIISLQYLFNGTVTESVTGELDLKMLVKVA